MTPTISQALEEFRKKYVSSWMVDDGNNKLLWNDKVPTPNQVLSFLQSKLEELVRGERKRLKDGVELWMNIHEKQSKSFKTDDLIKYLFEESK